MNFQKRSSRLKVTYMFMALTNSLVALFIAVLLQIIYSNAFCFPLLLWLYLGNSQVSVYRTICPTLVLQLFLRTSIFNVSRAKNALSRVDGDAVAPIPTYSQ